MIIEIDTGVLAEEKLTPTQFFILQLLSLSQHKYLKNWYESIDSRDHIIGELKRLVELEFIMSLNTSNETIDFTKLFLLPRGIKLLGTDRDWFQELVNIFPVKVIRSDGIKDYLRTDLARCRNIYNKKVNGTLSKHENIVNCLKYELQTRQKEGSMTYMKRIPKWLVSEEWTLFNELMLTSKDDEEDSNYGTEFI